MSNCKVIALTNQKGGVGKTTTAVNLGVSLVQQGKKVLLIDADAQANLTMALGYNRPDDIPITLSTVMQNIIDDKTLDVSQGIIHHREGVDLLPSNIELSGFEVRLINAMSRERVLKTYVNEVKKNYDYVLIDCMPSLGMITINALAAADSVIIPTQPHYLSAKGLELLLRSVSMVKRQINPKLRIDGILMTKEITAPYGMVLNEEVRSVELVYAGQNVDVTETATSFYNERQRVEIDLIKSLAIDEAYGIGKNGEIFDVTFGLYAAEELTAADGKTIPADGLIEVISLDESGHGKAISDLPMGSYYVQEISTNSAYIVSDAKYPVIFEYAGQDTETVCITANEGEAITNDIIYGSVSGKKSDEDGKALGGAVIGIFTTGTTEFTKENAIAATTSKDDGSFSFAKVPYGTWIIREIESPKGYVLSEEEIAVTIGKVDEVVEIELVNYFIKGNIALTKVDEDYPDNKLSGAVFEVYSDTNGDGKLDKDDTLLGEMKELDGGVYQMSELRYGKYLVKETKAPTGFVLDENVYSVSVEENGKTYTVENKAGVGFINAAQKGSLKIVKTSSDGKVEGFSFRVTGVDYDQTFKTDKNGEIVIEGLRIGDYTVSEVSDKASAGYILPADKQATVKVDATAIVQMHNEFRDTPKTGDDFNLGLWVSLAALSVVGAGVLGFVGYKNRKKKKED